MKFLVDAQISVVIANFLRQNGHDTIHTSWLPNKNNTTDIEICRISVEENRVVITKDSDFYHSFILKNEPFKLLLVTTGNISIGKLKALFEDNLNKIIAELEKSSMIEINQHHLKVIY